MIEGYQESAQKKEKEMEERAKQLDEKEAGMKKYLEEQEKEMRERLEEEIKEMKTTLAEEKQEWEEEKERVKKTKTFEKIVTLNVGGSRYTTTLSTLTKYPDSMLGAMFSGRHALVQQEDGSYFIDVDGEPFKYVLSYLRDREHGIYTLSLLGADDLGHARYFSKYFQLQELETLALVYENQKKKGKGAQGLHVPNIQEGPSRYDKYKGINIFTTTSHTHDVEYNVDKEENTLTCTRICTNCYNGLQITVGIYECTDFTGSFKQCNMSDFQFINCHFGEGFSFEGTILHNTVFQHCSGLVSNKVHFAPWQVAQAKFQPELLEALKSNGCVY